MEEQSPCPIVQEAHFEPVEGVEEGEIAAPDDMGYAYWRMDLCCRFGLAVSDSQRDAVLMEMAR